MAGQPRPGLQIFKDHGYNWIRLRLFHTPQELPNDLAIHDRPGKAGAGTGLQIPTRLIITPTPGPTRQAIHPRGMEGHVARGAGAGGLRLYPRHDRGVPRGGRASRHGPDRQRGDQRHALARRQAARPLGPVRRAGEGGDPGRRGRPGSHGKQGRPVCRDSRGAEGVPRPGQSAGPGHARSSRHRHLLVGTGRRRAAPEPRVLRRRRRCAAGDSCVRPLQAACTGQPPPIGIFEGQGDVGRPCIPAPPPSTRDGGLHGRRQRREHVGRQGRLPLRLEEGVRRPRRSRPTSPSSARATTRIARRA